MNESIQQAISKFGSQELLAKEVGVSQSLVSQYLAGDKVPRRKTAQKLEKAMENEIPWYKFMVVSDSPQIDLIETQSKAEDSVA